MHVRAAAPAARQFRPNRRSFKLSPRTLTQNRHVVGRSRNCSEPIARLRDPGGSGHSVAQLLCGLGDRLSLCRESYVLARISSSRCAKRERKRDACAPDRPAAQATWSAYYFHAVIVIPLRISCKPISSVILRHKSDILRHSTSFGLIRPEEMLQPKIGKPPFCFFAPAASRCSEFLIDRSSRFPLRIFLQ
jgi:hypothetical protein